MTLNVMSLDWTQDEVNYGAGLIRLFAVDKPPGGVNTTDYDLLQIFAVHNDDDGTPDKLSYKGSIHLCDKCAGGVCGGPPPPPPVPPFAPNPPNNSTNMAFRKPPDLEVTADRINTLGVMGPIWVRPWNGPAPTDVSTLVDDANRWIQTVGAPDVDLVIHLYNVIDPNGTHPLHQTTIGIPALDQ